MLTYDPAQRISAVKAMQHPYFKTVAKDTANNNLKQPEKDPKKRWVLFVLFQIKYNWDFEFQFTHWLNAFCFKSLQPVLVELLLGTRNRFEIHQEMLGIHQILNFLRTAL
jgi:hypothetical protein